MWKYVFWWFWAGSGQYPCPLLCWINLIYPINNIPAQFGRVASDVNHSASQIRMIEMPFQTRLLDLKFQNVRVTCFWIHPWKKNMWKWNCFEVLWIDSLFLDQGLAWSGQYMPNTPVTCHHKFQSDRCIWESTLHCMAFRRLCLFAISSLRFPSWPHRHRHKIPSLT